MKLSKIKAKLDAVEAQITALRDPFNQAVADLEKDYERATRGMVARQAELTEQYRKHEKCLKERMGRRQLSRFKAAPPASFKEFLRFAGLANRMDTNLEFSSGGTEVKTKKLEGCVMFCVQETFGREKLYGAWRTGGKLLGAMKVEPSRHPGDKTYAFAIVGGKEIFKEEGRSIWSGVSRPVDKFVDAVKSLL